MDKLKETFGIREKFSLENARHLCDEVEHIEEIALNGEATQHQSKALTASLQSIRSLTEVLVWMDRNNEEWFERVMERDVINTLERLVTNGLMPSAIKLQSLQSVTVLLQNLARTSSIYYVCSNNHINRMVAVEFDMHDDEFVSLYVSFLKTLALRCTSDTVQFFFDLQDNAFPLWDRAVRLLGSDDAMVRTAAKQIVVTIAQLQDSAVAAFVQRSIGDVFLSVMRNVDGRLTKLAADIPSHASLQRFAQAAQAKGSPVPSNTSAHSPFSSSPSPQQQQHQRHVPAVKTRVLSSQLEDIEDELLYLNDICHAPVADVGRQAAAAAQRLFLSRFQRIILQETRAAGSVDAASVRNGGAKDAFSAAFSPEGPSLPDSTNDIPASVALAFLLYWLQINTSLQVCTALMGFLVQPIDALSTTATNGNANTHKVDTSIAALVLQSSRVDLHEAVTAVFEHALVQSAPAPSPAHAETFRVPTASPLLRFPSSLSQFYYAQTPYQQTGQVLVGGPSSTLPPPKEKFVQKAWSDGAAAQSVISNSSSSSSSSPSASVPPPPQQVLAVLIPHLLAALHTQLRYFHVTRLSCFSSTLSLLLRLLPVDPRADRRAACASVWGTVYVELMKLIQRALVDVVKQYASVIQKAVRAQQDADGDVPLSRIAFQDIQEAADSDEEAPLLIRDPYTVMFLKLRTAAQWLDTDVADRRALLTAAHTRKDVHLFFPAFPTLDEERSDLMLNVWPPLALLHCHRYPAQLREQLGNVYRTVQTGVTSTFSLPHRSPVAAAECELNLYVMFLLIRHFFESRVFAGYSSRGGSTGSERCEVDVLRGTLRRLCPQRTPRHYFTLSPATATLSARCELASAWHGNATEMGFTALGAAMCLVLPSALTGEGGRELLLLDASANVNNALDPLESQRLYAGECKRRVLLSLDLAFVGIALHPRYAFKVVISYQLAGRARLLHVVMCDATTAKTVVLQVAKAADACRARGASFCFGITNYRSALLD